ncbi:MAG: hypothetical protein WBB01_10205 [Phormidesmis sp.]
MNSFKVHQRVGKDGILHLAVSVGLTEQELEVMVVYQPIQPVQALSAQTSLAQLYGVCADDPIVLDGKGISEALDDDFDRAFD